MEMHTSGLNLKKTLPLFQSSSDRPQSKNFSEAEEIRNFDSGRTEIIQFGNATITRATLQPGWQWSKSIGPLAETQLCEAHHFQYHVSGVLCVRMKDGTEREFRAGDVSSIPPGHDAWVVGSEPVVLIDLQAMSNSATGPHAH